MEPHVETGELCHKAVVALLPLVFTATITIQSNGRAALAICSAHSSQCGTAKDTVLLGRKMLDTFATRDTSSALHSVDCAFGNWTHRHRSIGPMNLKEAVRHVEKFREMWQATAILPSAVATHSSLSPKPLLSQHERKGGRRRCMVAVLCRAS
jgi:hypothetical protein